jgi:hypothetical protein
MHTFKWLSASLIILLFFSCSKPLPDLEGIDQQAWKNDRNGCNNKRATMKDAILKQKEKLVSLDELQIIALLGKPDRNELFKRNQKFFYYFLEPSDQCAVSGETPEKLSIRFTAMGLAKEVAVE